MDLNTDLKRLGGSKGHDGYAALQLLGTILSNILESPEEAKYHTLSAKTPRMKAALEHTEFFSALIALGFQKKIVTFEEKWSLPHLTATIKAKMHDALTMTREYLDRYACNKEPSRPEVTALSAIQAMQRKQQAYWTELAKQAEEDRLAKLEREERALARLKRHQDKQREDTQQRMQAFREQFNLLSKPPDAPQLAAAAGEETHSN